LGWHVLAHSKKLTEVGKGLVARIGTRLSVSAHGHEQVILHFALGKARPK
jgi:hypothetical protein